MGFVILSAAVVFGVGVWLTVPVGFWLRWVTRALLGGVLFLLLSPERTVQEVQKAVETVIPAAASASQASGADWVVHFLSFAGLGALLFFARRDLSQWALFAGLVGLGAVTEGLQTLVEGREAALGDFVADFFGVAVGYVVAFGLGRWISGRE